MRQKSENVFLLVGLIILGILGAPTAMAQNAAPPSLKDQLEAQYTLSKVFTDGTIKDPGSVLVIQQQGIQGVPLTDAAMPTARCKDGVLHKPSAGSSFGASLLAGMANPNSETSGQVTRALPVGEKVYISALDVNLKKDRITFTIAECASCNGADPSSAYKAAVSFDFAKGSLAGMSVPDVEDAIAKVFAIDTGTAQSQPAQPELQPEQPAAAQAASGQALTNDDVIKLVQLKLADSVVIAKIKSSACAFDTSVAGLSQLKQAGVSDAVLQAMVEGGGQPPTAVATGQPVILSENVLLSRGFSFDDQPRAMCSINGPDGPCQVEAFVFGELRQDPAAYTCSKLDRANYVGHCVGSALEGVSVVIADGTKKLSREAFVSYFCRGRMAYPALTSSFDDRFPPIFAVREKSGSYGCVVFGKWDHSSTRGSCPRFVDIYGSDIFTESNVQALRGGTFNLSHYGAKFIEYVQGK